MAVGLDEEGEQSMTKMADYIQQLMPTVDGEDFVTNQPGFAVINPATAEPFAYAPAVSVKQLDVVFDSAERAYRGWRVDEESRRQSLRDAADALESARDELAPILTLEQGKPLSDAGLEIDFSAVWLRYFADLEMPREMVQDDALRYAEILRRPLGVVAAITPWNFPISLAMWKIAPALRAGNTMVLKPSPYTPLTTLAMGRVLREVLPPGVLNVVTGPDPLGAAMTTHPVPRKISFTGSIATGKRVAQAAGADLKRVTLELGGNDPAVVLDDVDVDSIAESLFWSAFNNNGQICVAVKRVYAHSSVHDDLVDALAQRARSVQVGDGARPGVQLGPLNNKAQFDIVDGLVRQAREAGAHVAAGGNPIARPGYFFEPTILANVEDGVRIVDDEQFGPALPVVRVDDADEAVARANAGHFGLTASVWSSDLQRAATVAQELDAGSVSINVHAGGVVQDLPFGGHKWSGIGVENGPWGLNEYTAMQVVAGPPGSNRHPVDLDARTKAR
jgi:acyl-CoA reductase-like NAD-dependent aldehyde dehydrogenase